MTNVSESTVTRASRLLAEFNAVAGTLGTEYLRAPDAHVIIVNGTEFRIPAGLPDNGFQRPDRWIARKHEDGNIHEPGMISALVFLSARLAGQKVVFFDLGALFGYFSFAAHALFDPVEVHCVEANPNSAAIIEAGIARVRARHELNGRYADLLVAGQADDAAAVAAALDIDEKNVAVRRHRARKMLAEEIWNEIKATIENPEDREDERRALAPFLGDWIDPERHPSFHGA